MKRSSCADACAVNHDRPIARVTFQFIKGRKRCGPDLRKPPWSCAPAESGIIHSPDFYRAIVPHLRLGCCPAISAIRIAIKTQNEDISTALLLSAPRLSRPDLHLAVFERNRFANGTARIDPIRRREENQLVGQTGEHDHNNTQDRQYARSHRESSPGGRQLRSSRHDSLIVGVFEHRVNLLAQLRRVLVPMR